MLKRDSALLIEDMLSAIRKIERYLTGFEREGFLQDEKTIDSVVRNLEILGEAARQLPEVKPSVWEARMRFEQEQGALTEEFDIPPPSVDESTWRNPLDA